MAGDLLAVADISASESKKITVTDFLGKAVTLIADATIPNAKIVFGSASIPGSALQAGAVGATQIGAGAVTAAKLANESTVDLVTTLPASGAFVGQFALDTDDDKAYIWDGSQWVSFKAAGSINTAVASTAGIVNITVTTSGDEVTIGTSLDNTAAAAEFLAGPTGAAGAVSYRAIAGGDLPAATTSAKGGVQVNGNGLTMDGDTVAIDNTVAANTTEHHVVRYDANGLVTAGRELISGDLPLASVGLAGAIYPGTGLEVSVDGELDHINVVAAGTATKVTFDGEGHITAVDTLVETDIPNLPATKLTSGTIDPARIGNNSILGAQIANYAVSKFGDTQPTADHIGQFFFNPLSRDLFLWDGNVFQPIGISVGEIVFSGTFDASAGGGTGLVASVTAEGTAIGLTVGQALPAAAAGNSRYYLVVANAGTITSGNAPQVALTPPDIVLSNGTAWTEIDISQTITAQVASNVSFTPAGAISAVNVQTAIQEVDAEKLAIAGGTMAGELLIGTAGSLAFEGTTSNAFETTLAVVDPTADRTITFPNVTGTVVTTGDTGTVTSTMLLDGTILNADINASAAIAGSKIVAATTSVVGAVQLTDSTSSTSTTTAATPAAVKAANDLAVAALPKAGGILTGDVTLDNQLDLRFREATANGTNFVAFQAPASIAADVTFTLPAFDGTNGQVLSTNGTGTLSFTAPAAGVSLGLVIALS